jgi:hypothetical protein
MDALTAVSRRFRAPRAALARSDVGQALTLAASDGVSIAATGFEATTPNRRATFALAFDPTESMP